MFSSGEMLLQYVYTIYQQQTDLDQQTVMYHICMSVQTATCLAGACFARHLTQSFILAAFSSVDQLVTFLAWNAFFFCCCCCQYRVASYLMTIFLFCCRCKETWSCFSWSCWSCFSTVTRKQENCAFSLVMFLTNEKAQKLCLLCAFSSFLANEKAQRSYDCNTDAGFVNQSCKGNMSLSFAANVTS